MYSISVRLNMIFFQTLTLVVIGCAINYLSAHFYMQPSPSAIIEPELKNIMQSPRFNWDVAQFKVNLKADLSTFDNWNLKQVYLYLQFNYNQKDKYSESIVWDKIVDRSKIKNMVGLKINNLKYPLRDIHSKLRGQKVTLQLKAEIVPIVGPFTYLVLNQTEVQLPERYTM